MKSGQTFDLSDDDRDEPQKWENSNPQQIIIKKPVTQSVLTLAKSGLKKPISCTNSASVQNIKSPKKPQTFEITHEEN